MRVASMFSGLSAFHLYPWNKRASTNAHCELMQRLVDAKLDSSVRLLPLEAMHPSAERSRPHCKACHRASGQHPRNYRYWRHKHLRCLRAGRRYQEGGCVFGRPSGAGLASKACIREGIRGGKEKKKTLKRIDREMTFLATACCYGRLSRRVSPWRAHPSTVEGTPHCRNGGLVPP